MAATNNKSFYRTAVSCATLTCGSLTISSLGNGAASAQFGSPVRIGINAGVLLTSASESVAVGDYALTACTGTGNVGLGHNAGFYTVTGTYNVFLGHGADTITPEANYGVSIGKFAGCNSYGIAIGETAVASTNCISIGKQCGDLNVGSGCIAIGDRALRLAPTTMTDTIAIGTLAMGVASKTTSSSGQVAIGGLSLNSLTTGTKNCCLGYQTGFSVTTGDWNTFVGHDCGGSANVSGCTAIGFNCTPVTDTFIVAVGGSSPKTFSSTLIATAAGGAAMPGGTNYMAVKVGGVDYKIPLYV